MQGIPRYPVLMRDPIHLVCLMNDLGMERGDDKLGWVAGVICLLCQHLCHRGTVLQHTNSLHAILAFQCKFCTAFGSKFNKRFALDVVQVICFWTQRLLIWCLTAYAFLLGLYIFFLPCKCPTIIACKCCRYKPIYAHVMQYGSQHSIGCLPVGLAVCKSCNRGFLLYMHTCNT